MGLAVFVVPRRGGDAGRSRHDLLIAGQIEGVGRYPGAGNAGLKLVGYVVGRGGQRATVPFHQPVADRVVGVRGVVAEGRQATGVGTLLANEADTCCRSSR